MKILHIVEAWHGGIASYVDALVRAQIQQGHQVVLAADSRMLAADPRGLPCVIEAYPASRNPAQLPMVRAALAAILARHEPDIVHAHSTFPGVYLRCPTALHPRIVYTPHGWSFLKMDSPAWVRWGYGWAERLLASRARAIMCMSFEELSRARALGIAPERLVMIHTGIKDIADEAPASPSDPDVARTQGLKIGFFGRLDYQKGADLLPALAGALSADATLHVFGTEVRGRQPLQPHPRIQHHGWVAHQALAAHIASMDVIIIPSRWEGFSLTALEALRAGAPIIVSDLTSLSEVVIHGYNGLIMRDYSAGHLADLLNKLSAEDCRRMGRNARQVFLETYTFDRFNQQVAGLYQAVLSR
ncbi:D-inositol-3-phosphate glycosyltransferase [Castellaniella denitrificans]|uniref:glycosyltransferase n=1 Tax=Castellaniella sp. TaxID=1955812 RepID=UPI003D0F9D5E